MIILLIVLVIAVSAETTLPGSAGTTQTTPVGNSPEKR